MVRTYQKERFKAIKFDLYMGFELVYANHPTLYSRTLSHEEAHARFGADLCTKAMDNSEIFKSPYYGTRKRWLETPLP